jgi:hypothetical protein
VKIDSEVVKVVDISRGGICVDSFRRLVPDKTVRLQVVTRDSTLGIRCRILRCHVRRIWVDRILYRAAARFDQPLLLVEEDSPTEATAQKGAGAAKDRRESVPRQPSIAAAAESSELDPVFTDGGW